MKVNVRKATVHGKTRWRVDTKLYGKRVRTFFKTQKDANDAADTLREQQAAAGEAWLSMSAIERAEILGIVDKAKQDGASIGEVWTAYKQRDTSRDTSPAPSLSDAITTLIESKRQGNRRQKYIDELSRTLNAFADGRGAQRINRVSVGDIEDWMATVKASPASRAVILGRIGVLFGWAVRRGYRLDDPTKRIEKVALDQASPKILTSALAEAIMRYAQQHSRELIPYLTLCLFAGMRPEEVKRLTKAEIDLERGLVWLQSEQSKVRRRRLVHLSPNAIAWLRSAGPVDLTPKAMTLRRRMRAMKVGLKITWQADILRHTAASMMLARDKDAAAVALELGNSPAILLRHYRELVTKEEAEKFWAIMPTDATAESALPANPIRATPSGVRTQPHEG